MSNFGWVCVTIIAVYAIIGWASTHDAKVMEAADKYAECVQKEYHVSPAFWYTEHGEYPICPKQ